MSTASSEATVAVATRTLAAIKAAATNSYLPVAIINNVKIRVPKEPNLRGGSINRTTNKVDHLTVEQVLSNGSSVKGVESFLQFGQLMGAGVILNQFYFGVERADLGKNICATVKVQEKIVPGKGNFTSIAITKTSGIPTHELKFNSPDPDEGMLSFPIAQTDRTINFVPIERH